MSEQHRNPRAPRAAVVLSLVDLVAGRGRDGRRTAAIAALACAVATLVLLTGLSAIHASWQRDRDPAWQEPVLIGSSTAGPAAAGQIALTSTSVRGRTVTVVHVDAQDPTVLPDGLTALPGPGQVLASLALIDLARTIPGPELADRWGGHADTWSVIPDAALRTPDDLAVIVGVAPGDPTLTPALVVDANDPTVEAVAGRYTGFATSAADPASLVPALVTSGVALILVPAFTLLTASARLGSSRRAVRTARLRLAGATPAQARAVIAAEAARTALAGAVVGAIAHLALLPVTSQVRLHGARSFVADLMVGPGVMLLVVVCVTAVGAGAAVHGARLAIRDAWGTAQAQRPSATRLRRVLAVLAGGVVLAVIARTVSLNVSGQLALVVVAYALLGVLGASVVDLVGRVLARRARRAPTLLAGRRLADDPRGAWRQIGGLVLAGFVAGFFGGASLGTLALGDVSEDVVLPVSSQHAAEALALGTAALGDSPITLTVEPADGLFLAPVEDVVAVVAHGTRTQADVDTVLTALAGVSPGQPALAPGAINDELRSAGQALRETALGTLAISALLAAASTGCAAAASVLDRRGIYRSLRLSGVPLRVIDRARTIETVVPLVTLLVLTAGAGLLAANGLNSALGTAADTKAQVLVVAFCTVAAGATALSVRASSGLLARTSAPAGAR